MNPNINEQLETLASLLAEINTTLTSIKTTIDDIANNLPESEA